MIIIAIAMIAITAVIFLFRKGIQQRKWIQLETANGSVGELTFEALYIYRQMCSKSIP